MESCWSWGVTSEVGLGSCFQTVGHLPCHGVALSQRQSALSQRQPQEYAYPDEGERESNCQSQRQSTV